MTPGAGDGVLHPLLSNVFKNIYYQYDINNKSVIIGVIMANKFLFTYIFNGKIPKRISLWIENPIVSEKHLELVEEFLNNYHESIGDEFDKGAKLIAFSKYDMEEGVDPFNDPENIPYLQSVQLDEDREIIPTNKPKPELHIIRKEK